MPGLVGIASTRGPEETSRRFRVAFDRMRRGGSRQTDFLSGNNGRCLLAHLALDGAGSQEQPPRSAQGATALFHGVLYNDARLKRDLTDAARIASTADLVAALYARDGAPFVDQLEGEFCLAVLDPDHRSVLLATDTVGSYPIYWRIDDDGLIFSSDLSALLAATDSARRLDLRAVADYLTIGAVFGDKTLASGVNLLDPGTIFTYNVEDARRSLTAYARLETYFQNKTTDQRQYFDALDAAFKRAVDSAVTSTRPVGLSLSGGLDSRAILGSAAGTNGPLRTYTLGVSGCADQVIAERLAALAGTTHHYFELNETYLKDFLPNMAKMVSLTDGMYLSHGLTEMLAIQFLDQTGIEVLLRGHGGELAKARLAWPMHTDDHVYGLKSLDELVPYLSARANYVTRDVPLARILTPTAAASAGPGTRDSFATALRGTGLSPAESCSYLYLRELNRRFTVPSLELFRSRVEVRLPFLDRQFLHVLLAAPPEWRDSTEIHKRLTAAGMPSLLKVRNSNTGAPADAGPRVEFVLDKFNTLFRRMNVAGYRHYHNFDSWMRRMLLESVETELLAPASRVQAFVNRSALIELIRETREGLADRSYLLQVLLILELWQRENQVEAVA